MFNKSSLSVVALVAALTAPIAAHGVVEKVVIGGKDFGSDPVWQVDNNGPAATTNNMGNKDLACGPGATAPSSTASASAGDTVEFTWSSSWPHTVSSAFVSPQSDTDRDTERTNYHVLGHVRRLVLRSKLDRFLQD